MTQHVHDEINHLIGEFMDLQEAWERDQDAVDWNTLEALARKGARAYNEGAGPSFHALALDGVQHSEFHERFLEYLLQADFDPFKLVSAGSGRAAVPVISHADLAEAANANPSSARMRSSLMALARTRFEPLAKETEAGKPPSSSALFVVVKACAESIPDDLLQRIAPELLKPQRGTANKQRVNPVEGYLSTAEVEIEKSWKPYG